MNVENALTWFKRSFGIQVASTVAGTPLSVDLIAAIAYQETGYLWGRLIQQHDGDLDGVLTGCVGDTFDQPKRKAWPKTRAALEAAPRGPEMFTLARTALAGLAEIDKTYNAVHDGNPNKFCHGFGILQNDIQHFQTDPDFFLEQRWGSFAACLAKAVRELKGALRERGLDDNASLTNFEASTVAITYNTGTYNPSRKLKQGFKSDGKYYGELVFDYISRSQAIQVQPEDQVVGLGSGQEADQTIRQPGTFEVIARGGLRLRGGPGTEFQILDLLGFGDLVSVLAFTGVAGDWAIVDIEGDGTADGCAFAQYLRLLASQPGPAATGEPAGEEAPEDSEGIEEQPT